MAVEVSGTRNSEGGKCEVIKIRRIWKTIVQFVLVQGRREPSSHLKTAQMITEPQGLDDHGRSLSQWSVTECTHFLSTH